MKMTKEEFTRRFEEIGRVMREIEWAPFCDSDAEIDEAIARLELWRKARETGDTCGACGKQLPKGYPIYHTHPRFGTAIGSAAFFRRAAPADPDGESWGYGYKFPTCGECLILAYGPKRLIDLDTVPIHSCISCGRPVWMDSSFELIGHCHPRKHVTCSDRCERARRNAEARAARTKERHRLWGSLAPTCWVCGEPFKARRNDAKTCSNTCRQRLYRRRH